MEASRFLSEGDFQTLEMVVLLEPVEGAQPIYHFFVDGGPIQDVGVTRDCHEQGLVTYNFYNNYRQFAAADIIVGGDIVTLEWAGTEGEDPPEKYKELIPVFVNAAVYADYGVIPVDGA